MGEYSTIFTEKIEAVEKAWMEIEGKPIAFQVEMFELKKMIEEWMGERYETNLCQM